MNILKSRTRFKKRIELERELLLLINSKYVFIEPLYGLTESTINLWYKNSGGKIDTKTVSIIKRLAIESSLINDCSKDVFETDERKNSESINKLKKELLIKLGESEQHV